MIWSTQRPVETQLANSLASELHLHNHTPLSKTRRTYLSLSHAVNIKRRFGGGSALHEAEPGDFTVAGSSREASHWSEWENRARSHSLAVLSCSCFLQLSTLTMMPFIFLQFLLLLLTDVFFFFFGFHLSKQHSKRWPLKHYPPCSVPSAPRCQWQAQLYNCKHPAVLIHRAYNLHGVGSSTQDRLKINSDFKLSVVSQVVTILAFTLACVHETYKILTRLPIPCELVGVGAHPLISYKYGGLVHSSTKGSASHATPYTLSQFLTTVSFPKNIELHFHP